MDVVRFESCPQAGKWPQRTGFPGLCRCPQDHTLEDQSVVKERKPLYPSGYPLYILAYTSLVNADIYMKFREAVDSLCSALTHEDVAKALGVSVQSIRQARMKKDSKSYREPPKNWERAIIRLAENRASYYRRLIEKLRKVD
jgi:hypothetical protein